MTSKRTNMPSSQPPNGSFDAFAYYSNDLFRMKALLLKEDDEILMSKSPNANGNNSGTSVLKRRRGNYSQLIQDNATCRKTRLSFEVHPSLLLDDLILATTCDAAENISDDEDEDEVETKDFNVDSPTSSSKLA